MSGAGFESGGGSATPGLLLISHGDHAEAALRSARMILGEIEGAEAIGLPTDGSLETLSASVEAALDRIGPERPVIVLVDLFGGSCSNVAVRLLPKRPLRVVAGLNLAMVVEFALRRSQSDAGSLVEKVLEAGRRAVLDVNARLAGRLPGR